MVKSLEKYDAPLGAHSLSSLSPRWQRCSVVPVGDGVDRLEKGTTVEKKCKDCGSYTSEESGRCFYCAEELAYLLADAAREFGGNPAKFAQSAWN